MDIADGHGSKPSSGSDPPSNHDQSDHEILHTRSESTYEVGTSRIVVFCCLSRGETVWYIMCRSLVDCNSRLDSCFGTVIIVYAVDWRR